MITFSQMLLKLQEFWAKQGCNIVQPYDIPAGAGTFHPATLLRSLDSTPWSTAYVAPVEDQQMEDMEKIQID